MIKVKVEVSEEYYLINVTGHANYDKYGNDIVCSAVSIALIMNYNLLEKYNSYNILDSKVEEGNFNVKVKRDNITSLICSNLVDTLEELSKMYPKNINVSV